MLKKKNTYYSYDDLICDLIPFLLLSLYLLTYSPSFISIMFTSIIIIMMYLYTLQIIAMVHNIIIAAIVGIMVMTIEIAATL